MAFTKKTWKDRITEFPTRRTLTKSDGSTEMVTVARAEGTVSQEGDSFSAENMNNLENRIGNEFGEINKSLSALGGFEPVIDESTGKITGYKTAIGGADTVFPFSSLPTTYTTKSSTANGSGASITLDKDYKLVIAVFTVWGHPSYSPKGIKNCTMLGTFGITSNGNPVHTGAGWGYILNAKKGTVISTEATNAYGTLYAYLFE